MEPKFWLFTATTLIVSGSATAYFDDQQRAESILSEKAGLPDPVLVQWFDPSLHVNAEGEASLIGEVDLALASTFESSSGERLLLVPVMDVSSGGRHAAKMRMFDVMGQGIADAPHRPVPRSARFETATFGALLVYALPSEASTSPLLDELGLHVLGYGFHGKVVHVDGLVRSSAIVPPDQITDAVGAGVERVHLIAPFPKRRATEAGTMPSSGSATAQIMIACLFFAISALLVFAKPKPVRRSALTRETIRPQDTAITRPQSQFLPIVSQEEIFESQSASAAVSLSNLWKSAGARWARFRNRR